MRRRKQATRPSLVTYPWRGELIGRVTISAWRGRFFESSKLSVGHSASPQRGEVTPRAVEAPLTTGLDRAVAPLTAAVSVPPTTRRQGVGRSLAIS